MTTATAVLKNYRCSAQKVRGVLPLIKGKPVGEALDLLLHSNKKPSQALYKLLASAVANAENNHDLDIDLLAVKLIWVDQATPMKRMRARAKGRGTRVLKQSCHVTIVVGEK